MKMTTVCYTYNDAARMDTTSIADGECERWRYAGAYSTVTDFARLRGLSTSQPRSTLI